MQAHDRQTVQHSEIQYQRRSRHPNYGFFKGCPLQCKWCSNPESQNRNAAIADAMEDETYSGREYTVEEVLCEVRKDKPFL